MRYSLRHNLSYCLIDGHAIFLDIDGDRYFQLETPLETAFLAYVHDDDDPGKGLDALIERAVLVPGSGSDPCPHRTAPPTRSALELTAGSDSVRIKALLEVFMIVRRTRRRMRTQNLRGILDDLVHYREGNRLKACPGSCEARILDVANLFARSRLFVPYEKSCLLDSLALTSYMAAQGLSANIVFGVTNDPFSAHCWVQSGDLVLNDTVGNATAHTPIRVI